MENLKIRVNSRSESKEAQELFFQLGYSKGACSEGNYPADIVAVPRSFSSETPFSSRSVKLDHEEHKGYKELTLPEIRAMANPMKEYLDSNRNYELVLSTEKDDGFIEIPELSQFAVLNGDDEIAFYGGNGLEKSHFISSAIIWQRDQDEPFLTPECTLNDQYAEIEQVRKAVKVKSGSDSNHALDAMSFGLMGAGAAQASGGVDATLTERQSQYGCYEDVAHVTQQILSALRVGNYDELPAPMKESLHMIASKMARIVNGDPEYLDNWHDISGYAKLIEKLIKGE